MARLRPSSYPAELSPRRNAASPTAESALPRLLRNPISGIPECCAYTPNGERPTLPAMKARKSRRLMGLPRGALSTDGYNAGVSVAHLWLSAPSYRLRFRCPMLLLTHALTGGYGSTLRHGVGSSLASA